MSKLIKPAFRPRYYDAKDATYIKDLMQICLYMRNGALPCDFYVGQTDGKFTAVFLKSETDELYKKYRRFELR